MIIKHDFREVWKRIETGVYENVNHMLNQKTPLRSEFIFSGKVLNHHFVVKNQTDELPEYNRKLSHRQGTIA